MEIIDQIKQVANIVDIASQYTSFQRRGKKHVGLCPFHSEKTPSFTVDEEKQLFHCFGCGAGGDIFTLVMEKESLGFPEALRYLAEKYNIKIPEKKKFSPQLLKLEEKLYKINEDTLAFFKKNLFNTQEGEKALDYLHKRNISEEIIQKLKIGYALNSWDSIINFFRGKNIPSDLLEKAGLVLRNPKKESYYDRFRGRIIFPIFTLAGKVVAFGGRTTFNAEPKYLNSPDTLIYSKGNFLYGLNFCKDSIREKREVILVEGYTDFIALFQAGITNVAASLGTSLTSQQVTLASRFAPKIVVSYDSDVAGIKASIRAISLCFENGVQIMVMTLPEGYDPDSYIKKYGASQFKDLSQKSTQGLKVLIESYLQKGNIDIPEEKAKIIHSIIKEIEKIPDSFVRSDYLKQTSEYLSVDEGTLRSAIQKKSKEKRTPEKDLFLPAEKRLLQIFFDDSSITSTVFKEIKDEDFKALRSEPIFNVLSEFFKRGKAFNPHEIKEKIKPSLFSSLSEVLQEQGQPSSINEARDCLDALKQHSLEKRWKEINAQIVKLERNGEKGKLFSYLKQRQEITEQLSILSQQN